MSLAINRTFYEAALHGNATVMKAALKAGANPNWTPYETGPAILIAVCRGYSAIVQILLENGADFDTAYADEDGNTLLIKAIRSKSSRTVALLLDRGGDIHKQGKDGQSAMHYAAATGSVNIIKALVAKGGNPHILTASGLSPFRVAVRYGHVDALKLFLSYGADINAANSEGKTVLHETARAGEQKIIELLLNSGADMHRKCSLGRPAWFYAVQERHLHCVRMFLHRGVAVDTVDAEGSTPLHLAAKSSSCFHLLLEEAVATLSTKEVHALVNKPDNSGNTPLHIAAAEDSAEVLNALLRHNADVNAENKEHETPLKRAVHQLSVQNVDTLLKSGAAVPTNVLDGNPFEHAADRDCVDSIVALLCAAGACVEQERITAAP